MTVRLTLLGFVFSAAPAFAQFGVPVAPAASPGPTQNTFMPNFYNRQNQPLSPYLNLLRGTNLGVNYFYGVRPGLPSGGQPPAGAIGRGGVPAASPTYSYLPGFTGQLEPSEGYVLPPAGHTNTYGNYFGTAGSSMPGFATGRGPVAPGLANTRPQPAAPAKPRQ